MHEYLRKVHKTKIIIDIYAKNGKIYSTGSVLDRSLGQFHV